MQLPTDLDDVDRQLIGALIVDGRATYAALAPKVGLSQAAVRTRVQRLLDDHIITITGRVDPGSFGLGIFAFVLLEVSQEVDKVAALVAEVDEAVFVAIAAGRFDVLVELRCKSQDHLLAALDRIRVLEGVRRLQTSTVLHYEKQDWTGVGDHHPRPPMAAVSPDPHLDDVDRRLLIELMADGRATYAALAPVVGLSQAAVRDRVIDLIDSRAITIQAHPVPEAMGIGGFTGLALKAQGAIAPIVEYLVERPETCVVARTLGRYDLMVEVWFDDADHLAQFLDDVRLATSVSSADTVPYLRVAHEEFGSGLKR